MARLTGIMGGATFARLPAKAMPDPAGGGSTPVSGHTP